jgi:NADH:ubiquinone oxidoreductase subunit 6 (subunit J)
MPGGDFHPVLFVIVAVWILSCALGVVLFKKIVYSAVAMVACFLGVAFAYALLNAPLVAVVQILVYVGAISVVVMFAIMLTEAQHGRYPLFFNRQSLLAAPLAIVGAVVVAVALVSAGVAGVGEVSLNPDLDTISKLLFNVYVLPFELVSLVLLAAMVGAILLARGKEGERP